VRVIDLSEPLVPGENVVVRLQPDPPVYLGHECYAWDVTLRSHTGTYFETSSHVFRDGRHTSDVPPSDLLYAAALCRLGPRPGRGITGEELEAAGGHVRHGDALLVYTAGDPSRYFERDAVRWMIERGVRLLGADLERYDTGFENPTGMFLDLFRAEIPIIAGLRNLDRLQRDRFRLIVAPLPIQGIGTCPARVLALEEQ